MLLLVPFSQLFSLQVVGQSGRQSHPVRRGSCFCHGSELKSCHLKWSRSIAAFAATYHSLGTQFVVELDAMFKKHAKEYSPDILVAAIGTSTVVANTIIIRALEAFTQSKATSIATASTKQVTNIQVTSIIAAEVLVAYLRLVAMVAIHTSY